MINILICGIGGKMGGEIAEILKNDDNTDIVCGVDLKTSDNVNVPVYTSFDEVKEKTDVIIDFSSPSVLKDELNWAVKQRCPVVLATTGYTYDDLQLIERAAKKTAVFKTANFSMGINLIAKLARRAAEILGNDFDIEIIEKHHNNKKDAPSGTAIMLADAVNAAYDGGKEYLYGRKGITGKRGKEIGFHSVRGGTITGEHEILFAGDDEIITISHAAASRKVFATGAIKAAKWLVGKPAGLYNMNDLLQNI